jgi:hypothetical protein
MWWYIRTIALRYRCCKMLAMSCTSMWGSESNGLILVLLGHAFGGRHLHHRDPTSLDVQMKSPTCMQRAWVSGHLSGQVLAKPISIFRNVGSNAILRPKSLYAPTRPEEPPKPITSTFIVGCCIIVYSEVLRPAPPCTCFQRANAKKCLDYQCTTLRY